MPPRPTLRPMLAAAAVLAACSSGEETAAPLADVAGGDYALTSLAGRPLPAPYAQNPDFPDPARAGALLLSAGGRGRWSLTVTEAGTGRAREDSAAFSYDLAGDRIAVSLDCPPLASCIAPPHLWGHVVAGGLVFDSSRVTRAPLVFQRLVR